MLPQQPGALGPQPEEKSAADASGAMPKAETQDGSQEQPDRAQLSDEQSSAAGQVLSAEHRDTGPMGSSQTGSRLSGEDASQGADSAAAQHAEEASSMDLSRKISMADAVADDQPIQQSAAASRAHAVQHDSLSQPEEQQSPAGTLQHLLQQAQASHGSNGRTIVHHLLAALHLAGHGDDQNQLPAAHHGALSSLIHALQPGPGTTNVCSHARLLQTCQKQYVSDMTSGAG